MQPREKINHIVQNQRGEADEDAPHVIEETKFWVTVKKAEIDQDDASTSLSANARVATDQNMMTALTADPQDGRLTTFDQTAIISATQASA